MPVLWPSNRASGRRFVFHIYYRTAILGRAQINCAKNRQTNKYLGNSNNTFTLSNLSSILNSDPLLYYSKQNTLDKWTSTWLTIGMRRVLILNFLWKQAGKAFSRFWLSARRTKSVDETLVHSAVDLRKQQNGVNSKMPPFSQIKIFSPEIHLILSFSWNLDFLKQVLFFCRKYFVGFGTAIGRGLEILIFELYFLEKNTRWKSWSNLNYFFSQIKLGIF